MSCERMGSRLLSYIDGRLKESERLDVEKHLATCAPCRLRVQEFRAISGLLDELPVIEPSPGFDTRVRALVAAEPVKQNWWAWLRVSPRVAFAACMLLLAVLWLGYYEHPNKEPLPWNGDPVVADEQMMKDLPVLEDHDLLSNFEPLKELPPPVQNDEEQNQQQM
jgi:Putative zinc-finger